MQILGALCGKGPILRENFPKNGTFCDKGPILRVYKKKRNSAAKVGFCGKKCGAYGSDPYLGGFESLLLKIDFC